MRLVPVDSAAAVRRCAALADTIWRAFYTPIIGEAQVDYMLQTFQSAEAITEQLKKGYRYALLYEGETPIGYCATVPEAEALKISKLYVLEAYRGQGAGRYMIEACARDARKRGFAKLLLTVNRHNPSVGFYEKMHFENSGTLVQEIGGGFVMDDYVMVRPLA